MEQKNKSVTTFEKGKYYQLVDCEAFEGLSIIPIVNFFCVKENLLMLLPERKENVFLDVSLAKDKFTFVEITKLEATTLMW